MLPIILDGSDLNIAVAGLGDGLVRRLAMLAAAGITSPIVYSDALPDAAEIAHLHVLFIAGLFADHHDGDPMLSWLRLFLYLTEDRLGCVAIEIAAAALLYRFAQRRECPAFGKIWFRAGFCFLHIGMDCMSQPIFCSVAPRPSDAIRRPRVFSEIITSFKVRYHPFARLYCTKILKNT